MSIHFAEVDGNGIVQRVVSANSREECVGFLGEANWVVTYMRTPGKNHASVGHRYHSDVDNFSEPQPYPNWTLDNNLIWQPPVPYPNEESLEIPAQFNGVNLSIIDKLALQPHEERESLYRWDPVTSSWIL